jgi:glucose-1-phosphate cytidylyltransferase
MKVVILAGGFGTRLGEETEVRPKPMVEIGGKPILWHILKHYSHYGFKEFFIALGYRGEYIKRFFIDYSALSGSLIVDCTSNRVKPLERACEDWVLHLIDTGLHTKTAGRVRRLAPWLSDETFMITYGDGVADVDLRQLLEFHRRQGKIATVTAVRPPARFGGLVFDGDLVARFTEKPQAGEGWINGGYLVVEPAIFDFLRSDEQSLEAETLERLAVKGQLAAYKHDGFWQCMDTQRDKSVLENYWQKGQAPWEVWR